MKKLYIFILVLILGSGIFFVITGKHPTEPQVLPEIFEKPPTITQSKFIDYRASFAIFTNGTFRVFTASMYHNLSSDVFIQADNPNIVQVKKENITWDDFFKTLPFSLTADCLVTGTKQTFCSGPSGKLKFYLNGIKTDDMLQRVIREADQALISYGDEDESEIQRQLKKVPELKSTK